MKKRIISLFLIVILAISLFAACGKKSTTISTEEAQKIALQEIGKTAEDVEDIHIHATQHDGEPCYQVHITVDGEEAYVYIDQTGKVLAAQK